VHVIAGEQLDKEVIPKKTVRTVEKAVPFDPRPYVVAIVAVAAALGVGKVIQSRLGIENVDLVFLTAVVGIAVRYGLWPSLFASIVASLCYNFFFLPPVYTFTITDPTNVAAFFFFTVIALLVSNVAAGCPLWRLRPWHGHARLSPFMPSVASYQAPARLMTCCGRPRIRRPRS
jgi:two-component system sensor histidine kinase KdpD